MTLSRSPQEPKATGVASWLTASQRPIYTVLHSVPPERPQKSTGVLIVPPFGWDELVSHRARRHWAVSLAEAGHPTLRLDLPSTGDSVGDPRDPELVDAWTSAIVDAADWLRAHSHCQRVAAIGIGLGGLLATRAASESTVINDLILWATRASGRTAMRELVAMSSVVASQHEQDADESLRPADGADVMGFLVTEETRNALTAVKVADMEFPPVTGRRALLLGRDGSGPDAELVSALTQSGFATTKRIVNDYDALMTHPQSLSLKRPEPTIQLSLDWLHTGEHVSEGTPDGSAPRRERSGDFSVSDRIEFEVDGRRIRETVVPLLAGGIQTFGILSEPADDEPEPLAAMILNAGTIRKVGLHRTAVEQARRWAGRGVAVLRWDLEGIGDADGPGDRGGDERRTVATTTLTSPRTVQAVAEVMDQLKQLLPARQFVLVGHCTGAYLGLHTALNSSDIVGAISVNQQAFWDNEDFYQDRIVAQLSASLRKGLLRRIRRQGISRHEVRQVVEALKHRFRRQLFRRTSAETTSDIALLDRLRDRGVSVDMFFARTNPFYQELAASPVRVEPDRWPNVRVEELPTEDHNVRAIWIQALIHRRMDAVLTQILTRLAGADPSDEARSSAYPASRSA